MPQLLFISRVALIGNCCFVAAFLLRYLPVEGDSAIVSTVIILGTVVAIVVNTLFAGICLVLLVMRRPVFRFVPPWLVLTNLLFFGLQAILLMR